MQHLLHNGHELSGGISSALSSLFRSSLLGLLSFSTTTGRTYQLLHLTHNLLNFAEGFAASTLEGFTYFAESSAAFFAAQKSTGRFGDSTAAFAAQKSACSFAESPSRRFTYSACNFTNGSHMLLLLTLSVMPII